MYVNNNLQKLYFPPTSLQSIWGKKMQSGGYGTLISVNKVAIFVSSELSNAEKV